MNSSHETVYQLRSVYLGFCTIIEFVSQNYLNHCPVTVVFHKKVQHWHLNYTWPFLRTLVINVVADENMQMNINQQTSKVSGSTLSRTSIADFLLNTLNSVPKGTSFVFVSTVSMRSSTVWRNNQASYFGRVCCYDRC